MTVIFKVLMLLENVEKNWGWCSKPIRKESCELQDGFKRRVTLVWSLWKTTGSGELGRERE